MLHDQLDSDLLHPFRNGITFHIFLYMFPLRINITILYVLKIFYCNFINILTFYLALMME